MSNTFLKNKYIKQIIYDKMKKKGEGNMLYKEENTLGTITLYKDILAAIVRQQVQSLEGKLFLGNYKGKLSSLMTKWTDSVEVNMTPAGLKIRVYVVVRFGTSIKYVTEALIQQIRMEATEMTELPVNQVSVVVTAVLSKQLAKRNIEVKG